MQQSLKVDKGTGLPLGNALRQLSMTQLECFRPIAFSINREFNKISASESIAEGTYRIASNLGKYHFELKDQSFASNIVKEQYTFTGILKPQNMESNHFNIHGNDANLITCLDGSPVQLTVIYRKGNNAYDTSENSQFLVDHGLLPKEFFVMSSRHTNVRNFSFSVSDTSTSKEDLVLTIESDHGDESALLADALKTLKHLVDSAYGSFTANQP